MRVQSNESSAGSATPAVRRAREHKSVDEGFVRPLGLVCEDQFLTFRGRDLLPHFEVIERRELPVNLEILRTNCSIVAISRGYLGTPQTIGRTHARVRY